VAVAAVSTKGQVTLPAGLRRKLGIEPHDNVMIESAGDSIVIRKVEKFLNLKGFLGPALPAEEEERRMLNAIAEHAKARKP